LEGTYSIEKIIKLDRDWSKFGAACHIASPEMEKHPGRHF